MLGSWVRTPGGSPESMNFYQKHWESINSQCFFFLIHYFLVSIISNNFGILLYDSPSIPIVLALAIAVSRRLSASNSDTHASFEMGKIVSLGGSFSDNGDCRIFEFTFFYSSCHNFTYYNTLGNAPNCPFIYAR